MDPGLAPHWLSCSEVYFTTIIFYYVGQTPPDVQWRKREKLNYQEHEKTSFFRLPEFQNSFFSLLLRKLFTSYMACYYLVIRVGKHSNSRSPMFYKTDALKNLAIFTGKHLCWRFFLINSIKKRLQHRCFPVNIAECLSIAFLCRIYM